MGENVNTAIIIIAVSCVISAVSYAIYTKVKTRRITKGIMKMLEKAIDGSFSETIFDESVMSAIESKMWQYLSSSEISARKTAEEKDKIKTLISDISHQTKTPISNIQLYSELLAEQELSDESADYVKKISSQSEKLNFLINSLVKLSRLETGIITLNPKQNNISDMLDEIYAEYIDRAAEKNLNLTLQNADINAIYDEKWTCEAIGNIVDNALKYTEKGKISIIAKEYEMFACIDISDTGEGISEDEQAKIFSRFYRSENNSNKNGAGIGLYLAREIIGSQNGYIKVTSDVGKGSVFSVFLSKKQ